MPELTPFVNGPKAHPLRQTVLDLVWHKYLNTPRHLQVALGPSEIGEPCDRKLAMNIMHEPKLNEGDPLPSIVGTAAHTWLENACQMWNTKLGRTRFITEARVQVQGEHWGHCDCLDLDTMTVIDWKFPGVEPMKTYKKNEHPGELYQKQGHLYGRAWARAGLPVKEIAIVFFPRGGMLSGLYIWSEAYRPEIAEAALERYDKLTELCVALDVEHYPERYKAFKKDFGHRCRYCSWFRPGDDAGVGCPGYTNEGEAK